MKELRPESHLNLRRWLEYVLAWSLVHLIGVLPRSISRGAGAAVGAMAYRLVPRLRAVGRRNLQLAFPSRSADEREAVLRQMYRNLGWLLAEFCQMRGYSRENTASTVEYDGLQHYLRAQARGKGVLVVTGHVGAWELSSFYHSLMGHPMGLVIRRLDNPKVDELVNHIRCLHGNRVLHKDDFARGLIVAMKRGETVGILMDTNMTPPQGIFVDFFGHQACTASGLARVAQHTGAAVLPGFMVWEPRKRKYVLRFGEEISLIRTGDQAGDIRANTQLFTKAIEAVILQYPDQWLWVHRRWKTRPEGEAPLYGNAC